jgi:hypothetical protein
MRELLHISVISFTFTCCIFFQSIANEFECDVIECDTRDEIQSNHRLVASGLFDTSFVDEDGETIYHFLGPDGKPHFGDDPETDLPYVKCNAQGVYYDVEDYDPNPKVEKFQCNVFSYCKIRENKSWGSDPTHYGSVKECADVPQGTHDCKNYYLEGLKEIKNKRKCQEDGTWTDYLYDTISSSCILEESIGRPNYDYSKSCSRRR